MRGALLAALLAAVLLPVLPGASADGPSGEVAADPFCIVVIQPVDGFRIVRVSIDEELTDGQRAAFWAQADADGDGTVSQREAEAFRTASVAAYPGESFVPEHQRIRVIGGDGEVAPTYAVAWRQVGHGFYQHVRAPESFTAADLETQEVREFSFHVDAGQERVTVRGGPHAPDPVVPPSPATPTPTPPTPTPTPTASPSPVIEYVVIEAPPGWVVEHVRGRSYNGTIDLYPSEAKVEIPAFDTKASPWSITFRAAAVTEQEAATPLWLPLAGLAAVAALVARRRA